MAVLHNSLPQNFVLTRQQVLRQLVATLVRVAVRAGKVMINS